MLEVFRASLPDGFDRVSAPGASLGVNLLMVEPGRAGAAKLGSVIAVVDARLDERADLAGQVSASRGANDAQLVIAAYERWGTEFPRHLRGEFAIVVWDARVRRLVAARDSFGVRPLYYTAAPGRFVIASDPEQILASGAISGAPDDAAVIDYLSWSFSGRERTFFEGVKRLRGGHALVATPASLIIEDYRRLEVPPHRPEQLDDGRRELRERFFSAVRGRMRSDHPVLVHLSGGLDSTSIACVADAILATEPGICPSVTAVAALHPGLSADETPFIRAASDALRLPTETWDGAHADEHELDRAILAGPFGRYTLPGGTQGDMDLARRLGAKSLLSGTGGDQFGTPDGVIQDAILEGRWGDAVRFVVDAPGATLPAAIRVALRVGKSLSPSWVQALHRPALSDERHAPWMTPWALRQPRLIDKEDARPAGATTFVQRRVWAAFTQARHLTSIEQVQQHALRNGVDVRFPFMDLDLALFALSLPSAHWPPPWSHERLHRAALGDLLPAKIRDRRSKAPFVMALANRVRRQLGPIRALFASSFWRAEKYVDQVSARVALARFEAEAQPGPAAIWAVWGTATLETWLRAVSGYNLSRLGGPNS
ncbi:MAG: hypothetical protein JWM82_3949 [Myxococcales bacterium]|nr:hypothetical protein [Myxococcales bacterium]